MTLSGNPLFIALSTHPLREAAPIKGFGTVRIVDLYTEYRTP
jgi:hypothetical protein